VLLGDAGFDGEEVWRVVKGLGVRPLIRLREKGEVRDAVRRWAAFHWEDALYRFRGVVEGVFGGMKSRWAGGYLMERKPSSAMKRIFLEAIAYDLRILLTLTPVPKGFKPIY
jgi:hypothetical protein